jgi:hypothetical protein
MSTDPDGWTADPDEVPGMGGPHLAECFVAVVAIPLILFLRPRPGTHPTPVVSSPPAEFGELTPAGV